MRLLFDTNVILDIALNREPHHKNAIELFKKINNKSFSGFVTATTITDLYYIIKKDVNHDTAISFIKDLIEIFEIIGIDKSTIKKALNSNMKDFEDAVQSVASNFNDIDFILTRNTKDFKNSKVKAISPRTFLKR